MNRGEIRTRVWFHLQQSSDNSNFTAAQVNSEINEAYKKLNNIMAWPFLETSDTFSTVASQDTYYLPSDCRRLVDLRQLTTPSKIEIVDALEFDKFLPDPSVSGTSEPYKAILYGEDMTRYPTGSSTDSCIAGTGTTTVVSSASGISSTDDYYNDWLLINTTRSSSSRVSDYVGSTKTFTLSTAIASQASTDTFFVVRKLQKFILWPTPSSAITVYRKYIKNLATFSNDYDYPEWGSKGDEFHDLIALYTAAQLERHNNAEKSKQLFELATQELDRMRKVMFVRSTDFVQSVYSMDDMDGYAPSKLPGSYPVVR